MGCWAQITAASVTGGFGEKPRALAHKLLRDDVVSVIASDSHNAKSRPPGLKQAFIDVAQEYGEDRARRLMLHTPAAIVASQLSTQAPGL